MNKKNPARKDVLVFVAQKLQMDPNDLNDEMLVNIWLAVSCTIKFARASNVGDVDNFTLGELVRQMTN